MAGGLNNKHLNYKKLNVWNLVMTNSIIWCYPSFKLLWNPVVLTRRRGSFLSWERLSFSVSFVQSSLTYKKGYWHFAGVPSFCALDTY